MTTSPAQAVHPPCVRSSDLLRGSDRLFIEHGGEAYQLRLTRLGKLILIK